MKTYLVTGAAGFIGANYLKYILAKHSDIKVVVLDALTYAGNLGTIANDIDNERCFFVKGDICDRELAARLFGQYEFADVNTDILPGVKGYVIIRYLPTRFTVRLVPKAISMKRLHSVRIARTVHRKPVPIWW